MSLHGNGIGFLAVLWQDGNASVVPTGCWQRLVGELAATDRRASNNMDRDREVLFFFILE